ncbi:hypothetical protein LCGC14_0249910 [marine sediment metagenome]|uniref:Uncharacterized protein n=1 Tax=marine sediment metagenome TaxID=412755 RepID=A0A0F9X9X4_9ZZZZ
MTAPNKEQVYKYFGNFNPTSPIQMIGKTQSETKERVEQFLARFEQGMPRECEAGTADEMRRMGYVGLYAWVEEEPSE